VYGSECKARTIAGVAAAILALAGCVTTDSSPALEQARLELLREQIELTKLNIELTKETLARMRADKQATEQSQKAAAREREAHRRAAVAVLRSLAQRKTGHERKVVESLADWVEAGGDPDSALRAVAPGGGLAQ